MDVKLSEILKATGGKALGVMNEELPISGVSTDTRTIEKGDVFFALTGPQYNGHNFISEALQKGATHVVVSDAKKVSADNRKNANFIQVDDTLTAYGDLAKAYRQKFKIPAVAITGSSGKTTVKELVAHVLSGHFNILKNKGTENNLIGVPKTIFQLNASHQVLVIEMGTNQPGEIERLASIISPQIGMITQIGHSHLEGLKSLEGVKAEKLKLLTHLERGGILILNGQDPYLADVKSGTQRTLRVGFSKEGLDLKAEQIWCHEKGTSFYVDKFAYEPTLERALFETQLIGRHNVVNCLFAILAGSVLGVDFPLIQKGISTFKPVPGRLTLKKIDGIQFIDDSYNSNPGSFKAAVEILKEFKIRDRKGIVCGDMLELGSKSEEMHREIGALMAELLFDFIIAAGPMSKYLVDEALKKGFDPTRIHHVDDSAAAGKLLREMATAGDLVLVKGSRGTKMEKVFECFSTSSIR
jgi:UDP-N-acetylmuramoyl-tripeptide--D-alanyl-D-alanine ligase